MAGIYLTHCDIDFPTSGDVNADPDDPSEWDFTDADRWIASCVDDPALQITMSLIGTKPVINKQKGGPWPGYGPPENLTQYEGLIRNICRHYTQGWPAGGCNGHYYADRIETWVFWLGYDDGFKQYFSMDEYVEMHGAFSRAIKSVDPSYEVATGDSCPNLPGCGGVEFLEECRKRGYLMDYYHWQLFDIVPDAFRYYTTQAEGYTDSYSDLTNLFDKPGQINQQWHMYFADDCGGMHPEYDNAEMAAHEASVLIGFLNEGMDQQVVYKGPDFPLREGHSYLRDDYSMKPVAYAWKGFSWIWKWLADDATEPVKILQSSGSDKFGFAVGGLKSIDNQKMLIYISNFNPKKFIENTAPKSHTPECIARMQHEYNEARERNGGIDATEWTGYNLTVNLPWTSPFSYERYVVNDTHHLTLVESRTIDGKSFTEDMPSPSVHIIKLASVKPPFVEITRPKEGCLYIFDREITRTVRDTIIIGKITVESNAESDYGIENVGFYIDDVLQYSDYEEPYTWLWDETVFGWHEIKAVAYDKNGNTASDKINAIIFNIRSNNKK